MLRMNQQGRERPLIIAGVLLAVSFSASAAITPPWQGPYIGAYLGGIFGNTKASTNVDGVTDTSYFQTSADVDAVNNSGSFNKNPSAVMAGVQAGNDWVVKKMVYGVAMDYSTMPLHSSKTVSGATYPDNADQYSVYTAVSTDWLFTLRGRVGYQAMLQQRPALFYVTGGMALTSLKVKNSFSDNSDLSGAGGSQTTDNQIGWMAGAGMELALLNHLSADLSYAYVQVPSVKTTGSIANTSGFGVPAGSLTSPFSTTGKLNANLIKIGLNYRFGE